MPAPWTELLPLALTVTVSPLPVIAMVVVLATPRGRVNGPAMLGGWMATLAAVGGLAAGGAPSGGAAATARAWVSIVFGALLLVGAWRQWRDRPARGSEASLPGWMAALDRLPASGAAGVGALTVINPKNLVPALAGAALVGGSDAPAATRLAAWGTFVALASAGVAAPLVIHLLLGERARHALERLRRVLAVHNAAILTALFLVLGLWLLRGGLAVLR